MPDPIILIQPQSKARTGARCGQSTSRRGARQDCPRLPFVAQNGPQTRSESSPASDPNATSPAPARAGPALVRL